MAMRYAPRLRLLQNCAVGLLCKKHSLLTIWKQTRGVENGSQLRGYVNRCRKERVENAGLSQAEGDRRAFETLCRSFAIGDKQVRPIAPAVHDAALEDGKFGRSAGVTINLILQG